MASQPPPWTSTSYMFDPRPNYPLVSTMNRYLPSSATKSDDGVTLIFAHGTGFHKEQWEPMIEDLLALVGKESKVQIREIWSIDASNHGDSAILNEEMLQSGYEPIFGWNEYARSIHAFLTGLGSLSLLPNGELSPLELIRDARKISPSTALNDSPVPYSFTGHRLVLVGHSMGAISHLLALDYFPSLTILSASSSSSPPSLSPTSSTSPSSIQSIIVIEPMTTRPPADAQPMLAKGASTRRDKWNSREDALKIMSERKTWAGWDPRVLRVFVDHGLRSLPTIEYPDPQEKGVTLKCTRKQETASYKDSLGFSTVYRQFRTYVQRARVHVLYGRGGEGDYLGPAVKNDVINNAIGGAQNLASLGYMDGAGHLAPQTHPQLCAEQIYRSLVKDGEYYAVKQTGDGKARL